MVSVEQWKMWGSVVEVDVTEGAALSAASSLIASYIDDVEAVCDLQRGDAEIHEVNLSQGAPVKVSRQMSSLLRSALWAARMTDGVVGPLALATFDEESMPPVHPTPTYLDVQIDDDIVFAPWGASFDIADIAKADTVGRAADLIATELECGVAVRIGEVVATAGHCPAGGWQIDVPSDGVVELANGTSMATVFRDGVVDDPMQAETEWDQVTVVADDPLWAFAAASAAMSRRIGAIRWIDQHGLQARLVDRTGRVITTDDWAEAADES